MKLAFTSTAYATVNPSFNAAQTRWEMLDSRCENMLCLFPTEAEALSFKAISLRQLADREKWEAANQAAQKKAAEEHAAYIASFKGFLSSDPMRAGKQMKTLEKKFLFRGEPKTRKQIVETLVNEGRTVTENGLESSDGRFMVLGKTERAFAEHLIMVKEKACIV